ncbi:ABC transporter ATP-binding protein [Brenneria goodwinii]|uniref:ABC transporter ATP-binding protein n=1 Tax=Brenneria goodwinii TaxID=1109412 RepID=UPI000EF235EE|nr:oligopeptide/dipeptide ABC transporter ATP-binding protein [Brenneria goodwinii]MCG8173037.1 ABC transporter ATP-binding protein [Brenneria goodwinii]MCG8177675.1 ABC transporter ATP-binding protein [Brenneria goodwinii]MCG8182308.1 ABC transporter ATP-binding protein [Brenneria goodwinii]MCG8187932.1 ABC transporter ATP-binding protein [Brenneria goodwinii]MCG8196362.1 ABC transporter ATP-binding protein [Brenneria goodwinii]
MNTPLLTVRHLSKTFQAKGWRGKRFTAVEDVSFHIMPGETYALVGESGSGKSTTGRSLLGLTTASGGEVTFDGRSLLTFGNRQWRDVRKDIQMIFQDPLSSLDPKRSVGYSIEEPLIIHGVRDARRRREQVGQMLCRVGFTAADAQRYPHEFSGGQRQRIGIARALILEPKLIICDEPVSALDVSIQSQILNLLMRLQREQGLAYLFIAHDLSVVHHIADRVGVMSRGAIVEEASVPELFAHPQHPYTRYLLQAIPPVHPRLKNQPRNVPMAVRASGCEFHDGKTCLRHADQYYWLTDTHRVRCNTHAKSNAQRPANLDDLGSGGGG